MAKNWCSTRRFFESFLLIVALSACSGTRGPVRKVYEPAVETPSQTRSGYSKSNEVIRTIQNLYQRGDYYGALQYIESTPENQIALADRSEFFNLRGLCYLGARRPSQAEASFRKAMSENRNPEYTGYFQYNLANAFFDSQRFEESAQTLDQINLANLDPMHRQKVQALRDRIRANRFSNRTSEETPSPTPSNIANSEIPSSISPNPEPEPLTETTAIEPTPTEVYSGPVNSNRVGLLLNLSGKYESFGQRAKRAIEFAVQRSDLAGKIELVVADAGNTPDSHLKALQKLVEQDHVIAVIGPILSKGLEAIAAKAEYYQIPLISIAQAQGPVSNYLFSCSVSNQDQVVHLLEQAMTHQGMKRFAILAPRNKSGIELSRVFWDEVDRRGGEIRGFEFYEPTDNDFRDPVDRLLGLFYREARESEFKALEQKRAELKISKKTIKTRQYFELPPIVDFDGVFLPDEARTVGQIIPTFAYRDADDIRFLGITSWNSSELIKRTQKFSEGSFFPVAFNSTAPSRSMRNFIDDFKSYYNGAPGEVEAIAYDSAQIVLRAFAERPGDRQSFREQLENEGSIDGGTGKVSMVEHRCSRPLSLLEVNHGRFIPAGRSTGR